MYDPMMGNQTLDKGKGKLREEDFENAFAQAAAFMHQAESAKIEELDEDRFTSLDDAMRNTSLSDKEEDLANLNSMQLPAKQRLQEISGFDQCVCLSCIPHPDIKASSSSEFGINYKIQPFLLHRKILGSGKQSLIN
jgi:hypothetical protein